MPLEAGDVTRPGTAATVRPSASAIRAHASSPGRSSRLHHHRQPRQSRDDPLARRLTPAPRLAPAWQLRHDAALPLHALIQRSPSGLARHVQTAGHHRHRPSVDLQRSRVCGDRDPVGERAGHGHAARCQPPREALRHLHAVVRRPAAPDDGHGRLGRELPEPFHPAHDAQHPWTPWIPQGGRVAAIVTAHRLHALHPAHVLRVEARIPSLELLPTPAPDGAQKILVAQRQQIHQSPPVAALVLERCVQRREQPASPQTARARARAPSGLTDRSHAARLSARVASGRRMKNKGLGFCFARTLRRSRPLDRSRTLIAGRQIGSCDSVLA